MQTYDAIVIGAGHNGLVCAAYLLNAGYKVLLLEKHSLPGGGATTEEALPKEAPGFQFNLCAIDHEFIHLGPVIQALFNLVKDKGGEVLCDRPVKEVLIDNNGGAAGVRVADGSEYLASKGVISNIDARRLLLQLVPAVESPAELGERLGAYKGNYYHLDMSLDRMVFLRLLPEIANYTTPIESLYLTGAGTHPGDSISGMPGRNCARIFLQHQQPLNQMLQDASESLKSVFKIS